MLLTGWIVLLVITFCILVLVYSSLPADIVLLSGLTLLIIFNILTPQQALAGFSNQGVLTVGALFIVAAGLKQSGVFLLLERKTINFLERRRRYPTRLMVPVILTSVFVNNSFIVNSLSPALENWSKKNNIPPTRNLIALIYAGILGGACTLLGASVNLIINGLLVEQSSMREMYFFELAYVGMPCAIAGYIYMITVGDKLLRSKHLGDVGTHEESDLYSIEVLVEAHSDLSGKSLKQTGLSNLPGLYLANLYRDEAPLPITSLGTYLKEGDLLMFVGMRDSIVLLREIEGLIERKVQIFNFELPQLSDKQTTILSIPEKGESSKQIRFQLLYDIVVFTIGRKKNKMSQGAQSLIHKLPIAVSILVGMIGFMISGVFGMVEASFLAAALMVLTGCCHIEVAKKNINWGMLIVAATSIGLGNALHISGAASVLATHILLITAQSPLIVLAITYLGTTLLSEVTNKSFAAILGFSFVLSFVELLSVSYLPFVVTIVMAASANFIIARTNDLPIGNTKRYLPTFINVGMPLKFIHGVVTLLLVPLVWPF